MHDLLVVGVPLLAILAGILFNRSDVGGLRSEMNGLRGEMSGLRGEMKDLRGEVNIRFNEVNNRFNKVEDHLGRINADLRQFYHLTGKLEARMDNLEKRG